MFRKMMLVLAMFVAAVSLVSASDTTLSLEPGEGLTQALERNHLSVHLLSRVASFGGISVEQFRLLPVGFTFIVPQNDIPPTAEEIAASRELMATETAINAVAVEPATHEAVDEPVIPVESDEEVSVISADDVPAQELESAQSVPALNAVEASAPASARAENVASVPVVAAASFAPRSEEPWGLYAAIAFAALAALLVAWNVSLRRKLRSWEHHDPRELQPGEVAITYEIAVILPSHEPVFFVWSGAAFDAKKEVVVPTYQCRLCKEGGILAKNADRHVRRAHAHKAAEPSREGSTEAATA